MVKLIFPCAMMLMSAGASAVYFADGDWRKGLYWFFATGITAAVTF
jgi:hypothetical protein